MSTKTWNPEKEVSIVQMLEDCEWARTASNTPFSQAECIFVYVTLSQYQKSATLTAKQVIKIKKLWSKI